MGVRVYKSYCSYYLVWWLFKRDELFFLQKTVVPAKSKKLPVPAKNGKVDSDSSSEEESSDDSSDEELVSDVISVGLDVYIHCSAK